MLNFNRFNVIASITTLFLVFFAVAQWSEPLRASQNDYVKDLRYLFNNKYQYRAPDTLFINQWATWCKPCLRELPELAALASRAKGRSDGGAAFVTITSQSEKEAKEMFENTTASDHFVSFYDSGSLTTALQAIRNAERSSIPVNVLIIGDSAVYAGGFTDAEARKKIEKHLGL